MALVENRHRRINRKLMLINVGGYAIGARRRFGACSISTSRHGWLRMPLETA